MGSLPKAPMNGNCWKSKPWPFNDWCNVFLKIFFTLFCGNCTLVNALQLHITLYKLLSNRRADEIHFCMNHAPGAGSIIPTP